MIKKIISGGQSGADRAGLDAAILHDIPHGGWCPKGRICEDGVISSKYNMLETETSSYDERTIRNIRDSDVTLIFISSHEIKDGTLLTIQQLQDDKKPFLILNVTKVIEYTEVLDFIMQNKPQVLNIAGPRESNSPGIYNSVFNCMCQIILFLNKNNLFHYLHPKTATMFKSHIPDSSSQYKGVEPDIT